MTNEKYTGDVILQKTPVLIAVLTGTPIMVRKNMYLIENHYEAIISHEDFEAVDAVLNQRAKENGSESLE